MLLNRFPIIIFLVFIAENIFAQTTFSTITGSVKDDKGAAVPFSSVAILGTNTGTVTDDKIGRAHV